MSCKRFLFEMSQALDGRLPSSKRAALLNHISECDPCAQSWEDHQRAQQLVSNLPKQSVSRGFRDELSARIQAGEGASDAIFGEPVPILAKAQYVLAGAAAAAVFLVAMRAWDHEAPVAVPPNTGLSADMVANRGGEGPTLRPTLAYAPVNPGIVATAGAAKFESSARKLEAKLRLATSSNTQGFAWNEIAPEAREFRAATRTLLFLEENGHLIIAPKIQAQLNLAKRSLEAIDQGQTVSAFEILRQIQPGSMRPGVQCCSDPLVFMRELQQLFVEDHNIPDIFGFSMHASEAIDLPQTQGVQLRIYMQTGSERDRPSLRER